MVQCMRWLVTWNTRSFYVSLIILKGHCSRRILWPLKVQRYVCHEQTYHGPIYDPTRSILAWVRDQCPLNLDCARARRSLDVGRPQLRIVRESLHKYSSSFIKKKPRFVPLDGCNVPWAGVDCNQLDGLRTQLGNFVIEFLVSLQRFSSGLSKLCYIVSVNLAIVKWFS